MALECVADTAVARLTILIPAAGSSTRMRGQDKLLQDVAGEPILRRQARMALALAPVIVTLRETDPDRRAALEGVAVTVMAVTDAALGMSASFRAVAGVGSALMILPADMPDLTGEDLAGMIAAFQSDPAHILRGSAGDRPGHPVIWPRALVPSFARLTGDEGARALLRQHPVRLHPLPDQHALTDLDTPEDWAAWRAGQAASSTRAS